MSRGFFPVNRISLTRWRGFPILLGRHAGAGGPIRIRLNAKPRGRKGDPMDVKAIDGHRHIVVKEAVAAASKLSPAKSTNIYPSGVNERSEQVNRSKGGVWDRKMADMEENLADLKAAGMDMGVLQPTQTMFFYWTEPAAAAELARMVNEFTAQEVRKRPSPVGRVGHPSTPGYRTCRPGVVPRSQESRAQGRCDGFKRQRSRFRRGGLPALFRQGRGVGDPDLHPPQQSRGRSSGSAIITWPISWGFPWSRPSLRPTWSSGVSWIAFRT